jgi:N-acetyl-D-muramate 6-phosphate phosphatase
MSVRFSSAASSIPVAAVLFDLDGTLIDSAPDLAGAANDMRAARGLAPVAFETLRPRVGQGARGMVGAAFGVVPDDAAFEAMRVEFLDRYAQRSLRLTRIFDAMKPVLDLLDDRRIPWGIMTNKHTRFTTPIVEGLGLQARAGAVVCGDTTAHPKPHPAPLLETARRMGVHATQCWYVGDDRRDIEAARAAGMRSAAACWGYFDQADGPALWGADAVLDSPAATLGLLTARD